MDQKKGERELIYIDQDAKHLWPETISNVWCTKIINRNNIFSPSVFEDQWTGKEQGLGG